MALGARSLLVHARQREPSLRVVEPGVQPGIHAVAGFAGGGESAGDMVGIRCLLKRVLVARIAGGRQSLKLAYGRALMAIIALQGGVCAY